MDIPYKLNTALATNITCGQMELQVSTALFQDIFLFSFPLFSTERECQPTWNEHLISSLHSGYSDLALIWTITAPRLRWRYGWLSRAEREMTKVALHPSVCDCFLLLLALTHTLTSIQPMLMFPGTVEEHMKIVSVVGRVEVLDGQRPNSVRLNLGKLLNFSKSQCPLCV